ncbi:4-hydroxy 2-oxovalerate aldolase [Treponema bryantii]|uniref:4-hydroxy 2-oxovalerate aldolase n=1 Tax=Treponema bryantii TaxID=163 RepID=A0A1I3IWX9_9SPIR|nr:hypothetical protein [Treponema bryantii]SFI52365.1 4-hydroxy 2-oxovalerate aldolase [Treponema bryantii]
MGKVYLLDCTLRDGGYVNDWQFGKDAIIGTTQKIAKTGIEFFEIGFIKNCKYNENRAVFPNVQTIEPFIKNKSNSLKYVGMIDCGDPVPIENIIDFDGKSIDGIRVIFKKDKRDFAFDYCKKIQDKGYLLFVQFVGTDSYTDVEFVETINRFNQLNPYAMSIVDTFGTIKRKAFLRMVYLADNNMKPEIILGYHAHNNLQQAFGNAETLVELNLKRDVCIDACVFGMGRGAGNLNLELFADYMNENYDTNYKIEPMLEIMDDYLQESYNKRFWGYCLPYYLSATNNCHPNYAIYYAEKQTLTEKSFNELLKLIPSENKRTYSKELAEKYYIDYMSTFYDDHIDVNKLIKEFYDRNILLLAPGNSINEERKIVEQTIIAENPIIVAINCNPLDYKVDYIFSSNIRRYAKLEDSPIKKIITSNVKDTKKFDYKLNFTSYAMSDKDIIDNSGLMFLKFISKMNIKKVFIAGMDGYSKENNYFDTTLDYEFSHIENRNSLIQKNITELSKTMNVIFITKTNYRVED